jgi:hypothetical protein
MKVPESRYSIDPQGNSWGFGYSLTYNKVINDQYRIKYGWQINFPFSWAWDIESGGTHQETFDNYLKYKITLHNRLQFKVNFGLLK